MAAKLPEGTAAYTLRHSVISDLVHDGLDLLTVAHISGTFSMWGTLAPIDITYFHGVAEAALRPGHSFPRSWNSITRPA